MRIILLVATNLAILLMLTIVARILGLDDWLTAKGFDTSDVRAPVGIVLTVEARDGSAAAQAAREISDRFAARARIALGQPLERLPWLWVYSA